MVAETWRDTVMAEEELSIFWRNPDECDDVGIAEAQAKISFLVGERVGMKEVVDWIKEMSDFETFKDAPKLIGFTMLSKDLKKQLKKWGIDNG